MAPKLITSYFKYWGKAQQSQDQPGPSYHLLPYHCLDVAAIAYVWWDNSYAIRNSFQWQTESIGFNQLKAWMLFFIALHDYGKFDIRFQRKALTPWQTLQPDIVRKQLIIPTDYECKKYDHGKAGLYWFDQDRNEEGKPSGSSGWMVDIVNLIETSTPENTWLAWVKAVTGHHGFVYPENYPLPETPLHSTVSAEIAQQDKEARQAWLNILETLFLNPVDLSLEDTPPQPSTLLAGFCSVADWLGSRSDQENFCHKEKPTDNLDTYFAQKCAEDATRVFALSGMHGKSKSYQGVSALLKPGYKPRQLQTLVGEMPVKPGLAVIEAPTGSGKTEMALAYAWRLIAEHHADSIVFAMPSQATANAMLKRLERLATILFEDRPNLLLAHGNARFNENFAILRQTGRTVQKNEEAWAQCNEWLAQSRKRIFLGQIGICTVDQVLVSVLPIKHRFIRGFGIGRSVLIVDEVHAYDAYMYGLLEAVLRNQHAAGGSSILLSATLPQTLKKELLKTTATSILETNDTPHSCPPYPLISWADGEQVRQFTLSDSEQPPTTQLEFELQKSADLLPDATLCQRIVDAAQKGAQIAIVCNLVEVAQQLAQQLQKQTNINVNIFHARYCLAHRQIKEDKIIEYFGKQGKREVGRILVATQVIEQSLDVDFDWLITQLCPVDLLFQRMGRLHRHERSRPAEFVKPLCTILLPPGNDYGLHGLIYSNTRVMWRTAFKLRVCEEKIIEFPKAYREWIESIYQETPWGNEPEDIEMGFHEFEEKLDGKRFSAKQILNWTNNVALSDSDEKIRAVTRDDEFNLSIIPCLETSDGKQLLDSQVLEHLGQWQRTEALAMNTVNVPYTWKRYLPDPDDEERIWLTMQPDDELWQIEGNGMCFSYHPEWGMRKNSNNTE